MREKNKNITQIIIKIITNIINQNTKLLRTLQICILHPFIIIIRVLIHLEFE